ncbi:MAG: hypothetical protein JW839_08530 [Candidatus Lokiarchaeota archaeon]|nr:hypothetical protein [Candidatus Lokiarchaeota archaeon]
MERGAFKLDCIIAGSAFLLVLLITTAVLFNVSRWRAAIVWEAVVHVPASLVAFTATLVLVWFAANRAVAPLVHPFIPTSIGIACCAYIVAWKVFGRAARQIHRGSILEVMVPVAKLVIDVAEVITSASVLALICSPC